MRWPVLPQRAAVNEDASLYSCSHLEVYKKSGHLCPESCVTVAAQSNSSLSLPAKESGSKSAQMLLFFPFAKNMALCGAR